MMLAQGASCARRGGRALTWKSGASAPRQRLAGEWALALVSDCFDATSNTTAAAKAVSKIRSLNAALKGRSSTAAHTADPRHRPESRKPKAESRSSRWLSRSPCGKVDLMAEQRKSWLRRRIEAGMVRGLTRAYSTV